MLRRPLTAVLALPALLLLVLPGPALTANGFYRGGTWSSLKDYMHFSTTNR